MSAAESREKVIQRLLIRQIRCREPQRHFRMIGAQHVVGGHADVKKIPRRYSWWIAVIICRAVRRNAQAQGAAIG